MSYFQNYFIDKRNNRINFGTFDLQSKRIGGEEIFNHKDENEPINVKSDLTINTPNEHELIDDKYSLVEFLKQQVQLNQQLESRITDMEQHIQILLSTQTLQLTTTNDEVIKKFSLTGDLLTQFQNAVQFINNEVVIDMGFNLENIWKVEIDGYGYLNSLGNLVVKNDETGSTIINTGLWGQNSPEYENPKTILLSESRVKDCRYLRVVGYWNGMVINNISFYYKTSLNNPDSQGELVELT